MREADSEDDEVTVLDVDCVWVMVPEDDMLRVCDCVLLGVLVLEVERDRVRVGVTVVQPPIVETILFVYEKAKPTTYRTRNPTLARPRC